MEDLFKDTYAFTYTPADLGAGRTIQKEVFAPSDMDKLVYPLSRADGIPTDYTTGDFMLLLKFRDIKISWGSYDIYYTSEYKGETIKKGVVAIKVTQNKKIEYIGAFDGWPDAVAFMKCKENHNGKEYFSPEDLIASQENDFFALLHCCSDLAQIFIEGSITENPEKNKVQ